MNNPDEKTTTPVHIPVLIHEQAKQACLDHKIKNLKEFSVQAYKYYIKHLDRKKRARVAQYS